MANWGWNPDSFVAVGTVATSVIAVIALLVALAQGRSQRKWELKMRREQEERESRLVRCLVKCEPNDGITLYRVSLENNTERDIIPLDLTLSALTGPGELAERIVLTDGLRLGRTVNRPGRWLSGEEEQICILRGFPSPLRPKQMCSVAIGLRPADSRAKRARGGTFHIKVSFDNGYGEIYTKGPFPMLGTKSGFPLAVRD